MLPYWKVLQEAKQDKKITELISNYLLIHTAGVVSEDVELLLTSNNPSGPAPALTREQIAALDARMSHEKETTKDALLAVKRSGLNPSKKKKKKEKKRANKNNGHGEGAGDGKENNNDGEGGVELGGDGEGEGLTADGV